MKGARSFLLCSLIFVSLSTCKSKNIEAQYEVKSSTDDIENVNLNENKGPLPFIQLLTKVEEFVESSIHSVVQDFFLKNDTLNDKIGSIFSISVNAFHTFSGEIKKKGDELFSKQEKLISLIQCECPDSENKCDHILSQERKVKKRADENNIVPEENETPPLPLVDVLQLVTHFQKHFLNVLKTQRKVFDYAHCACPAKRECMAKKTKEHGYEKTLDKSIETTETSIDEDKTVDSKPTQNNNMEDSKRIKRDTTTESKASTEENGKGFFSDIFQWFAQFFPGTTKIRPPPGTHLFNGTLANGAHYSGGEFHNGNTNGYFIATHNNDSNGNSYSSSAAAGGGTFGNFGR